MKMTCIFVSYAHTDDLRRMTERAIATCRAEQIIVVEQAQGVIYEGVTMIPNTDERFNYNRALNKAIPMARGEYIVLCNNDVEFFPNFPYIADIMKLNNIHSASPYTLNKGNPVRTGNYKVDGYEIGIVLCGWCIVLDRYALSAIGGWLDETFDFWYSDNVYGEQLRKAGIPHSLICNVFIEHHESATLLRENRKSRHEKTIKAQRQWLERTNALN